MAAPTPCLECGRYPWKCKAIAYTGPGDPQDCDWPFCGCDPYADKVIEALQEGDYLITRSDLRVDRKSESGESICPECHGQHNAELVHRLNELYEAILPLAPDDHPMDTRAGKAAQVDFVLEHLAGVVRTRDLLRERLDQFEAYGMDNVAAALDRIKAEREEHERKIKALGEVIMAAHRAWLTAGGGEEILEVDEGGKVGHAVTTRFGVATEGS